MKLNKITSIITSTLMLSSATYADDAWDLFLPQNESYSIYQYDDTSTNTSYKFITAFAGSTTSSTSAGIHTSGKTWENGKLSSTKTYEFEGWATGYSEYVVGNGVTGSGTDYDSSTWTNPANAYGQASSSDTSDVVVLGESGYIVMTFDVIIVDGDGYDFVVYENALNSTALELAYVSVSSDGENFVTFPSFYLGTESVGSDSDGGDNDPTNIYNLGSKYTVGTGNGYDLNELTLAYEYALEHYDVATNTVSDNSVFSLEYTLDILENYVLLDLDNVNYIKITDIIGDGSCLDSSGNSIYDMYPTTGTSGFDLAGIGVVNGVTSSVPEPSTYAVILGALAFAVTIFRRKK